MTGRSSIEWTDATWNPTRGCSRVSEGCRNCYAERQAIRHKAKGYKRLVKSTPAGPRWTGQVALIDKALDWPITVREPKRIFVDSMSDLFHEHVPDDFIDRVFATMHVAQHHTFQVLTKRPERMRAYVVAAEERVGRASERIASALIGAEDDDDSGWRDPYWKWPLPNVHLGTSVETQATFDARAEHLGTTPAALRFLSMEPLLEEIDCGNAFDDPPDGSPYGRIDWVIVGGESGPGARACDVQWLRWIVAQCHSAGVPVFVKQLGAQILDRRLPHEPPWTLPEEPPVWREEWHAAKGFWQGKGRRGQGPILYDRKGGDWDEWPVDLRVREFPAVRAS